MKFAKPPTTFQEQVDLLKSRGLIINDSEKALQNITRVHRQLGTSKIQHFAGRTTKLYLKIFLY